MYRIYVDGQVLYDPRIADDGYVVTSATVDLEMNACGSCEFTIPPNNPLYNSINKLKSMVEIFDNDEMIFRGRVLHDDRDFNNNKEVYCEGELAWLMDNIVSPRSFTNQTVANVFGEYIRIYNEQVEAAKRFEVGTVNVTGTVNYTSYDFCVLLDEINNRLIEPFGGYIRTRYDKTNGKHYIDYLANYTHTCDQMIEFGMNMLDFSEYVSAENIVTVLIPLGKEIQDSDGNYIGRVNIKSVNNNNEYVSNAAAQQLFGNVWRTEIFNDIEDPTELKNAGIASLNKNLELATTINISAIDLNLVNVSAEAIRIGDGIRVFSAPHNLDQTFQCTKISYNLLNPSANTYEFGTPQVSISRQTASVTSNVQGLEVQPREPFTEAEIEKMREEVLKSVPTFNLLPSLYYDASLNGASIVRHGITWTTNGDGSITAKGTADSNGSSYWVTGVDGYALTIDPSKKYTLSGCPSGGSYSTYVCACRAFTASQTPATSGGTMFRDFGNGVTIPTGYKYLYVYLWVYTNYACPSAGVTFMPMVEIGETKHSFISTTTNSAVLISDISQNASNIQLKVSTTDYNGATIASLINQSAASVIIAANHISLAGKTIALTSDNITISSTNFSVANDGSMTCKAGNIAGWNIAGTRIEKDLTGSNGYRVGIQNSTNVSNGSAVFYAGCRTSAGGTIADQSVTNFYVRQDGHIRATSFKFGCMESVGSNPDTADADVWVRHALFVSFGIEILSDTNGRPYIDFHRDINDPDDHGTAHDFTARIVNNEDNAIKFYGINDASNPAATPGANCYSGGWGLVSDRRLKRRIKPLTLVNSEQFIAALKPSSFEYRNITGVTHHGFIYDEIDKVKGDSTWAISENTPSGLDYGDKYGSVNIMEIIPDLVMVVQNQMQEIAQLKQQMAYLGY